MKNSESTITLIGAGLVGSLLAVQLAKRGFRVEIFERRPDLRLHDISAGRSINLALANRGIFPLEQAALMEKIWPILTPMKGRMVHDTEGNQNFQSYGQKPEEVIYSVSRGELNKICMNAAEETGLVTIHFNQLCESVDFDAHLLTLRDQQSGKVYQHKFSQVIGTDGASSSVRDAIHERTSSQHEILPLGHSYKELSIPSNPYANPNSTTVDEKIQIDKNSLHIWPRGGYMLIALPNEDGSFTVTLFMPNEGGISFRSINSPDKVKAFFEEHFFDVLDLLPDLEKEFFENPTGTLATVKCAPWHFEDKALLLGDAAHAIVPFHGQGMNCGFEDVQTFVEILDSSDSNWEQVFAQTDKLRKENGDAIADMAIENYITMRDSVRDEKFLLKSALAFELENRFPEYFCPRYSMVMFHRLPYAEAKSRGIIQETILTELVDDKHSVETVDFTKAETLIKEKLTKIILNPAPIRRECIGR